MERKDMPVLFIGHGNPMNAIEDNEFSNNWKALGKELPKPKAILCISAHWETKGTFLTANEKPRTIHDFGGFPRPLYEVEYPAPGNLDLVDEVMKLVSYAKKEVNWGLDHGTWSVLKRIYPNADVPIVQLSIDMTKSTKFHFDLAIKLRELRLMDILIIGSGNLVHNLMLASDFEGEYGYDWALLADRLFTQKVIENDFESLINYHRLGEAASLAVPTNEHFVPLIYAMGLRSKDDEVKIFNNKPVGGSLTMTSFKFSQKC